MSISENWRLKDERYALKAEQLTDSEDLVFPPRPVKPRTVELFNFADEENTAIAPSILSKLATAAA